MEVAPGGIEPRVSRMKIWRPEPLDDGAERQGSLGRWAVPVFRPTRLADYEHMFVQPEEPPPHQTTRQGSSTPLPGCVREADRHGSFGGFAVIRQRTGYATSSCCHGTGPPISSVRARSEAGAGKSTHRARRREYQDEGGAQPRTETRFTWQVACSTGPKVRRGATRSSSPTLTRR